jgi:signal transduction histidine kinase
MARSTHLAIAAAALVAGAFEVAHTLAWQARLAPAPLAYEVAGMAIELEALTAVFDHGLHHRRSATWSFSLVGLVAVSLGIANAFAGWALGGALDLPLVGGTASGAAVVTQLGGFDGLVGLGLWAVAVLVPHAVRDAAAAREADRLRNAAELARLRANLQPHFLLNTLSTVAGLVGEDPREARDLIGALGDLLRDALEDSEEMQTLDAEVSWLQRYAKILEIRHRGQLAFRWDIAPAARPVRVPRLLLQPLVENAVKHGALRRDDGGEVCVRARVDGARMTCIVEDNGPGPGEPRDGARGIALVTRRLALRYDGVAAFRIEAAGGLTRATIDLPVEAST